MAKTGIIGCGYWGPKLIRNFVTCSETELIWACNLDEKRLEKVAHRGLVGETVHASHLMNDRI